MPNWNAATQAVYPEGGSSPDSKAGSFVGSTPHPPRMGLPLLRPPPNGSPLNPLYSGPPQEQSLKRPTFLNSSDKEVALSVAINAERLRRSDFRQLHSQKLRQRVLACVLGLHVLGFWVVVAIVVWNRLSINSLADRSSANLSLLSAKTVAAGELSVTSSTAQAVKIASTTSSASLSVSSASGAASLTLASQDVPVSLSSSGGSLTVSSGGVPILQTSTSGTVAKGNFSTDVLRASSLTVAPQSSTTFLGIRSSASAGMELHVNENELAISFMSQRIVGMHEGLFSVETSNAVINGHVFNHSSWQFAGLALGASTFYVSHSNFTFRGNDGLVIDGGKSGVYVNSSMRFSQNSSLRVNSLETHGSGSPLVISAAYVLIAPSSMSVTNVSEIRSQVSLHIVSADGPEGLSYNHATTGNGGNGSRGSDVRLIAGSGGRGGSSGTFSGVAGVGGRGGNIVLSPGLGGGKALVDVSQSSSDGSLGEVVVSQGNVRIVGPLNPKLIFGEDGAPHAAAISLNVSSNSISIGDGLEVGRKIVNVLTGSARVAGVQDQVLSVDSSAASAQLNLNGATVSRIAFNQAVFALTAFGSSNLTIGSSLAVLKDGSVRLSDMPFSFVAKNGLVPGVVVDYTGLNVSSTGKIYVGFATISYSPIDSRLEFRHGSSLFSMDSSTVCINATSQILLRSTGGTVVRGPLLLEDSATGALVSVNATGFFSAALGLGFESGRIRASSIESSSSLFLSGASGGVLVDLSQPVRGADSISRSLGPLALFFNTSTVSAASGDLTLESQIGNVVIGGAGILRVGSVIVNASQSSIGSAVARVDLIEPSLSSLSGPQGLIIRSHVALSLTSVSGNIQMSAASASKILLLDGANVVAGDSLTVDYSAATATSSRSLSLVSPSVIYLNASDSVRIGRVSHSVSSIFGSATSIDFVSSSLSAAGNLSLSAADGLVLQGTGSGVVLRGRSRISASSSSFAIDFGFRMISTTSASENIVLSPAASASVQISGSETLQFGSVAVPSSLRIIGNFLQQTMQGASLKIDFILNRITAVTEPLQIQSNRSLVVNAAEGVTLSGVAQTISDVGKVCVLDFSASRLYTTSGTVTLEGALETKLISGPNGLSIVPLVDTNPLLVTLGSRTSYFSMERPVATASPTYATLFKGQDACLNCGTGGSVRILAGKGSGPATVAGPLVLEAGSGESGASGGNVIVSAGIGSSSADGRVLLEARGVHVYTRGSNYHVFEVNTAITDGDSVLIGNLDMTSTPALGPYTDTIKSRSITQHHYAATSYKLHTESAQITATLFEFGDTSAVNSIGFPRDFVLRSQNFRFTDELLVDSFRVNTSSLYIYRPTTLQLQTDPTSGSVIEVGDCTANNKFPDNLRVRGRTITAFDELNVASLTIKTQTATIYRPTSVYIQTETSAGTLIEIGDTSILNRYPNDFKVRARFVTALDELNVASITISTMTATYYRPKSMYFQTENTANTVIEIGDTSVSAKFPDLLKLRARTITALDENNVVSYSIETLTAKFYRPTSLYFQTDNSVGSLIEVGDTSAANRFPQDIKLRGNKITMFDETAVASLTVSLTNAILYRSQKLSFVTDNGAGSVIQVGDTGSSLFPQLLTLRANTIRAVDSNNVDALTLTSTAGTLYRPSSLKLQTDHAAGTIIEIGDTSATNLYPQNLKVRADVVTMYDQNLVSSMAIDSSSILVYRPTSVKLHTSNAVSTVIEIGDTVGSDYPRAIQLRSNVITFIDQNSASSVTIDSSSLTLYRPQSLLLRTDFAVGSKIEIGDAGGSLYPSTVTVRGGTISLIDQNAASALTITSTSVTLQRSATIEIGTPSGTATSDVNIRGTTVRIMNAANAVTSAMIEATSTHLYLRVSGSSQVQILGGSLNVVNGKVQEGSNDLVPSGTVVMYDGSSCPAGWSVFSAPAGRVIAAVPAGQAPATYGSAFSSTSDADASTGRIVSMSGSGTVPTTTHDPDDGCCGGSTTVSRVTGQVPLSVSARVGNLIPISFMLFCRKN